MKKCSLCQKLYDLTFFYYKKNGERHIYCKICSKLKSKQHYLKNKKDYILRSKINKKKYIEITNNYILNYLKSNPCVDCGESDPVVLEFDHVKDQKNLQLVLEDTGAFQLRDLNKK